MRLKINRHGIFGLFAIVVMFVIAASKDWQIPWVYFVVSILLYSISVIILSQVIEGSNSVDADMFRIFLGCHLAFLFLALGMLLHAESVWVWIGVFLAAIAAGLAIPYLLLKSE